jgi:hypothetical protein
LILVAWSRNRTSLIPTFIPTTHAGRADPIDQRTE